MNWPLSLCIISAVWSFVVILQIFVAKEGRLVSEMQSMKALIDRLISHNNRLTKFLNEREGMK